MAPSTPGNGQTPTAGDLKAGSPSKEGGTFLHRETSLNRETSASDFNDGAGFSRNPKLSLTRFRPAYGQAALPVGEGVTRIPVVLQYRQGLSVGPIRGQG